MHIEFLVEELSAETALSNILPRILESGSTFAIHPYQGKTDLIQSLPSRLRGYRYWLPESHFVIVLVDLDDTSCCTALKDTLENIALNVGFATKSSPDRRGRFKVINRIAIEELEAWFFGDVHALVTAYPRIPNTLGQKARYRDPDAIKGGTWETLERVLKRAGYFQTGYNKNEGAKEISQYMDPVRNVSHSFAVFRDAIAQLQ